MAVHRTGGGLLSGVLKSRAVRKRAFLKLFVLLDRLGLHVLPKHHYSPVPDHRWLRQNEGLWLAPIESAVIAGMDLDQQVSWLEEICGPHYDEVVGLGRYEALSQLGMGPGYGPIESQVLHCFMRKVQPARVIEIGGGVTTACMTRAAEQNAADGGRRSSITCIEPYPYPQLLDLPGVDVMKEFCQAVPLDLFRQIGPGDLLFIDSSHSVKTGSEVLSLYLEVIPSLPPGVFVHIHDIYLPYAYPRDALEWVWNWQETCLLLALLAGNPSFEVLASLSMLHYRCPRELGRLLTDYRPQPGREGLADPSSEGHFPCSIWLRTRDA